MSTYCTTTSLQTLLPGYSFSGTASSVATLAIEMADADVNAFMSKRYDITVLQAMTGTTLNPPPKLTAACRLYGAAYFLSFQSRTGKESMSRAESYRKIANEMLEKIMDGEMDLLDSNGNVIADKEKTNYRVLSNTKDYSNTFDEDESTSWRIDPDKIDDISDDRDS